MCWGASVDIMISLGYIISMNDLFERVHGFFPTEQDATEFVKDTTDQQPKQQQHQVSCKLFWSSIKLAAD